MQRQRVTLLVLATCGLYATGQQTSNYTVSTTSAQAVLRVRMPRYDEATCTIKVYRIDDVNRRSLPVTDPDLFDGADRCATHLHDFTYGWGTFEIGHVGWARRDKKAAKVYDSQHVFPHRTATALPEDTRLGFDLVPATGEAVISGTFATGAIPFGVITPWHLPGDPEHPGDSGQPTAGAVGDVVTDPMTGFTATVVGYQEGWSVNGGGNDVTSFGVTYTMSGKPGHWQDYIDSNGNWTGVNLDDPTKTVRQWGRIDKTWVNEQGGRLSWTLPIGAANWYFTQASARPNEFYAVTAMKFGGQSGPPYTLGDRQIDMTHSQEHRLIKIVVHGNRTEMGVNTNYRWCDGLDSRGNFPSAAADNDPGDASKACVEAVAITPGNDGQRASLERLALQPNPNVNERFTTYFQTLWLRQQVAAGLYLSYDGIATPKPLSDGQGHEWVLGAFSYYSQGDDNLLGFIGFDLGNGKPLDDPASTVKIAGGDTGFGSWPWQYSAAHNFTSYAYGGHLYVLMTRSISHCNDHTPCPSAQTTHDVHASAGQGFGYYGPCTDEAPGNVGRFPSRGICSDFRITAPPNDAQNPLVRPDGRSYWGNVAPGATFWIGGSGGNYANNPRQEAAMVAWVDPTDPLHFRAWRCVNSCGFAHDQQGPVTLWFGGDAIGSLPSDGKSLILHDNRIEASTVNSIWDMTADPNHTDQYNSSHYDISNGGHNGGCPDGSRIYSGYVRFLNGEYWAIDMFPPWAGEATNIGTGLPFIPNNPNSHPGCSPDNLMHDFRAIVGTDQTGSPSNPGRLVPNTQHVWLFRSANNNGIYYQSKRHLLARYTAQHSLVDISGPRQGDTITDATDFSLCYAEAAGECRAGSQQHDMYVSTSDVTAATYFKNGREASGGVWDNADDGDPTHAQPYSWPLATASGNLSEGQRNGRLRTINVYRPAPGTDWHIEVHPQIYSGQGAGMRTLTTGLLRPGCADFANTNHTDALGANLLFHVPGAHYFDGIAGSRNSQTDCYGPSAGAVLQGHLSKPPVSSQLGNDRVPVPIRIQGDRDADAAVVRFGYGMFAYSRGSYPASEFYGTARAEETLSVQTGAGKEYYYAGERWRPAACPSTDGCTIYVPALRNTILHVRVDRYRGTTLASEGQTQLVVVN